jgi:hypothetical protein
LFGSSLALDDLMVGIDASDKENLINSESSTEVFIRNSSTHDVLIVQSVEAVMNFWISMC